MHVVADARAIKLINKFSKPKFQPRSASSQPALHTAAELDGVESMILM